MYLDNFINMVGSKERRLEEADMLVFLRSKKPAIVALRRTMQEDTNHVGQCFRDEWARNELMQLDKDPGVRSIRIESYIT